MVITGGPKKVSSLFQAATIWFVEKLNKLEEHFWITYVYLINVINGIYKVYMMLNLLIILVAMATDFA